MAGYRRIDTGVLRNWSFAKVSLLGAVTFGFNVLVLTIPIVPASGTMTG